MKKRLPNLLILKPGGEDFVSVEDVAAVKKQGCAHQGAHAEKVRETELLPFGDEEKSVGVLEGGVLVGGEGEVGAEYAATFVHCCGVVDRNGGSRVEKPADDDHCRGFADVVRFRLESDAPEGYLLSVQIAPETSDKFVEQDLLLPLVDILHSLEDAHFVTILLSSAHEGLHVFWETTATIAAAGVKELVAYASVGADSLANLVEIRADEFAEVRDVVHE